MDEYSWTQDEVKTLLQYKKLNYAYVVNHKHVVAYGVKRA
jgi:hypothetical protein